MLMRSVMRGVVCTMGAGRSIFSFVLLPGWYSLQSNAATPSLRSPRATHGTAVSCLACMKHVGPAATHQCEQLLVPAIVGIYLSVNHSQP